MEQHVNVNKPVKPKKHKSVIRLRLAASNRTSTCKRAHMRDKGRRSSAQLGSNLTCVSLIIEGGSEK